MKNTIRSITLLAGNFDRRYIQVALVILAMGLLVLGAGAPTDGGGSIP
jgi:hypothetical protein